MLIIAIVTVLIFATTKGYFNQAVSHAIEFFLSNEDRTAKLENLAIEDNKISIGSLVLQFKDSAQLDLESIDVVVNLGQFFRQFKVSTDVKIASLIASRSYQDKIFSTQVYIHHDLNLIESANVTNINFDSIELWPISNNQLGKGKCIYESHFLTNQKLHCNLDIGNSANLAFNSEFSYFLGKIESLKLDSEISNIPIFLYKTFLSFLPQNDDVKLIEYYIQDGIITSGKLNLNLDKEFFAKNNLTENNLNGSFHIDNFELKYDDVFPTIKKMDIDVTLNGAISTFLVNKAYSSNTLLSDGVVTFKWEEGGRSKIFVKANAKGPAVDLIDFIVPANLENLKKKDIDFRKLTGEATTTVDITIPLEPNTNNTYNITSEVQNVGLKILKDNIEVKKGKISGIFDGHKVELKGNAKINDFASEISYKYDFNKVEGVDQLLNIRLKIEGKDTKYNLINVRSGNAILDFEYKNQDDKGKITVNSNLKDLDFYLDKISINKSAGERANLSFTADTDGPKQDLYSVKLVGDNDLEIIGNINAKGKATVFNFPVIKHKKTSVKAEVKVSDDELTADLQGETLDLTDADMMQFLKKDKKIASTTNIKLRIDKIKLKNDISLKDIKMKIKCDKEKCYKGYLDSKIGSKFLKMLLKTFDNKEEWVVTSNNAGAVFKGFGLYNNMKAGSAILVLSTSRREITPGEIVPIIDGSFTFKKFAVVDAPVLTRMVSFISLPGFVNIMRNNKDIIFTELTGKFSYDKNLIRIHDAYAQGPFFDFTMGGEVDTKKKRIKLKGSVVPSLYGISTMIKYIPVIGKVLSGGRRKGIVSAPYAVDQDY